MKLLVVTPMREELNGFLQTCIRHGYAAKTAAIGRLPVARIPDLGITLARGGTGKAQFAVQTQHLLDKGGDWDLVVCAGAAGALAADLSVGDVVVATATIEHDYDNRFSTRPLPRFEGAPAAIDSLRRVPLASHSFKAHFGPIVSGDEDIVDPERRRALHQSTGALVVAWEGAGGARACAFSGVPFVEIRGVTDVADQKAPSDFEANLGVAMGNVAALILSWIDSRSRS
ncbi:MAG TPA: 5'-methylthioadenosine/S-adenosylhomocysteine nucleosidase [Anaerolineae bacterium]|nr:5'-methylthioadenosine/S-adenosylhomocysteine nucleosidase [Anaerolineae bacterium]